MRIVHVISGLGRGGAESVLARLVTSASGDSQHSVVTLSGEGHFGRILRSAGVPVHLMDLRTASGLLNAIPRLARVFRNEQPDVIQTWMYHANAIGGISARVAKAAPVIWSIRNTNLDASAIGWSARWAAWFGARLSRSIPAAIVCPSWESRRVHVRFGYDESKFRMIPNGYDTDRLLPNSRQREAVRAELGIRSDDLVIGNVARWDPQKDHANLLDACRRLHDSQPALRVLLVGDGMVSQNSTLAALVRRAGLEHQVVAAGPRDDVSAVMNAIDVHVLSSLGEAFPNTVAEAMACGTPCVVTDVGDAARIVGDTGWVVPARNSKALAEAIAAALSALARTGRESIGRRTRARIQQEYSLDTMARSHKELWHDVARARPVSPRNTPMSSLTL